MGLLTWVKGDISVEIRTVWLIKKRVRFVVLIGRKLGEGELEEGGKGKSLQLQDK